MMTKDLSKEASLAIVPVVDLPIPTVAHATANNTLYPMLVTQGTRVTVAFTGMTRAHKIQLHWDGPEGPGRPTFPIADGSASGSIEIEVDASVIGASIGKTVEIWYSATLNGQTENSIRLELTVEVIKPIDLPAPVFLDVVTFQGGRWLDMRKFAGNARIELAPWPFIAKGQRLWILAVGNEHHVGNYRFEWVLQNHLVTAQEAQAGFVFLLELLRDWLARCDDYSSVTLSLAVTFDGAPGTAPTDPSVSLLPENAHELQRTTENLRVGEPELHLPPPRVVEATECGTEGCLLNPINATHGATIRVAYEGMRDTDWVCAYFEGTPGAGTPALACVYGTKDGFVDFPVPASAISANFCGQVTVRYSVMRDVLWSSPPLKVKVLTITDLPTPEVTQATGRVLDLNTFAGKADCTVEPWDFIAQGQSTWLRVTGELEDGTPYSFDVLTGETLPAEGETDGVISQLPRSELEKLADCSKFAVHFAVNFNGRVDKPSAVKFPLLELTLHQQDLVLIAPTVREAVGSVLNPENAQEGVTVRVEYDRISPRHMIQPHWIRPDGTSLPMDAKPGNSFPGHVDFTVPFKEVIACIGKTVSIRYTVTSQCKQANSPDLKLEITVPKHWPMPEVLQATSGILDLRNFPGNADAKVRPWSPWIVTGQRVWLSGEGTSKDGNPCTFDLIDGELVTADEVTLGLQKTLQRTVLESLRNLSTLTLTCRVALDGNTNVNKAVVFAPLEVTVRLPFDDLTTFDDYNWNGWKKGPAANHPDDLVIRHEAGNWFLFNWTNTSQSAGVFLWRNYAGLEINRSYEFSISIKRVDGRYTDPVVSLLVEDRTIVDPVQISDQAWQTLKGVFTATAPTMLLQLFNHVATGGGNDFAVDNIRVKEL